MIKQIKQIIFIGLFSIVTFTSINAQEGMWLPMLINQNEADMKAKGLKISASDIYNINSNSLKDAIISFSGFCTGGVVSNQGLVFTNHHCGYGAIQALSTVEKNYLKDGYWAKSFEEELPAEGLFVQFIVRMEDVTDKILMGVTDAMSETDRQSTVNKNVDALKKTVTIEKSQDISVRPFYDGNQYIMFITESYKDIRFVGAPPSAVGKYGDETDNWVWPRHTGDFSVFRIYADKDNKPATFNKENVPYKPKRFLKVSLNGVKEDEFNMILGFPGRTQEYLPSFAIKQIQDEINPRRIAIRERALKILDAEMRKDDKTKLQYASKYSVVANYYKKWRGENLGLIRTNAIDKKINYEKEFDKNSYKDSKLRNYSRLLSDYKLKYDEFEPYAIARNNFNEVFGTNSEMLSLMQNMSSIVDRYNKDGEKAIVERIPRVKGYLEGFYKDYRVDLDKKVFSSMIDYYFNNQSAPYIGDYAKQQLESNNKDYNKLTDNLYANTMFTDGAKVMKLLEGDPKSIVTALQEDPMLKFAKSFIDNYNSVAVPKLTTIQPEINKFQRNYMKGQMLAMKNKKFYPDANSTLRVAYGKSAGYKAKDGVYYLPKTTIDGLMAKYIPNDYEFDVPEKLRTLYKNKDYGQYVDKDGTVPVCFLSTAQTTGGNSGSPCLDANGNLIGLLFDGSWEGVMSDLSYDETIVRSIVLDARYLLFIIDKYGDAKRIIGELKLVK
ncbi:MAG: S46 family peptidase [Saprospiraceae bacterium]|nr:S46 family peptidase [Saprospiraceae bacterium]